MQRNVSVLHVVLYNYEIKSVILRKKHNLLVFESNVVRRKMVLKGGEITIGWDISHGEGLHGSYSLLNVLRMVKSWNN
jgi:hypothetical protein